MAPPPRASENIWPPFSSHQSLSSHLSEVVTLPSKKGNGEATLKSCQPAPSSQAQAARLVRQSGALGQLGWDGVGHDRAVGGRGTGAVVRVADLSGTAGERTAFVSPAQRRPNAQPAPATVVHDSCCQAATHQATPRDLLTDLTHSSAADCQMEATALRAARAARERWAVPAQDMDLGQVRSSSLPSRFSFAALTGCFALMGTSCGNTMALTAARLS